MPRYALNDEQKRQIEVLREDRGISHKKIGRTIGAPPGTVGYYCLVNGIEKPNWRPQRSMKHAKPYMRNGKIVRPFTWEDDALIFKMERDKKNYAEIGRALGRPSNSIKARLATLARYQNFYEERIAA